MLKPRTHLWFFTIIWFFVFATGIEFLRRVDPTTASSLTLLIFYVLIFLWIMSLTTIFGYLFRAIFWNFGVRYELLNVARRQGVWFGLIAVSVLLLSSYRIFNVWTGILVIAVFLVLEFYILAKS